MSEWGLLKLSECLEKISPGSKILKKNFLGSGKYPIVSQEKWLVNGYWDAVDDVVKTEKPLIIFGDHTQVLKYIDFDFVVGADGVKLLKPKLFLNSKYLYYFLMSNPIKTLGYARHYRLLKETIVRYPSFPEQKRIVTILDKAFEGVDKAIANTEKNLANARELFERYLDLVFFRSEEGWEEKSLCDVLDSQPRNGWSPPAKNHSDAGMPVLTLSSVTGFEFKSSKIKHTSADTKNEAHYWVENGDLLITRSNTPEFVGHVAIAANIDRATIYPDLIMKMKINKNIALTRFVYYQLRSTKLRGIITSSAHGANPTMKKINKAVVQGLPLILPGLEKQKELIKSLDSIYEQTQLLSRLYLQKLNSLNELKQSLLQKAFSGELTSDNKVITFPDSKTAKNPDPFSPEFAAKILAFAYHRHVAKKRHNTFGHVKAQKTLHLVESIAGIDLDRKPIKDAAGPNDFRHMLNAEAWAKEQQFFEFVSRGEGKGYDFKKLVRYDELMAGLFATLKPYQQRLEQVVDLIIPKNSQQTELLATVHAAWNNLILDGCEISDEAIINEARENWHPDKMKIPVAEFQQALRFIRDKGLVPDGKARRVGDGQENLF